jgi:hypothetical protein
VVDADDISKKSGYLENGNTSPVVVGVFVGRGPQAFKARDVTRAVKAVTKAGVPVARVMIDKSGNIVVIAGSPAVTESNATNEWDEVFTNAKN